MTHEQLAATMAQFGPTPKVFKAIVPFDQATYDNCVHEADFPDPRGTGFGHGQNQRHRAHQAYTCCCIGQLPVDDQCILRGMQYLPMQLGALFYRIYLPHLQHNVQVRREEGGSATSHPGYLCRPRHCRWTWSKAGYGLQQVSTIPPRRNLSNYTTTLPTSMQSLRQFGAPVTATFLRICT